MQKQLTISKAAGVFPLYKWGSLILSAIFKIPEKCDIQSNTYVLQNLYKNMLQKEWQLIRIIFSFYFKHYLCSKRSQIYFEITCLKTTSQINKMQPPWGEYIVSLCSYTSQQSLQQQKLCVPQTNKIVTQSMSFLGRNFS